MYTRETLRKTDLLFKMAEIYHLQLKTKEDSRGSGLEPQMGGRQLVWRWESRCLVNKCLLDQARTMRHREEF